MVPKPEFRQTRGAENLHGADKIKLFDRRNNDHPRFAAV
jgi:hypothetical protein